MRHIEACRNATLPGERVAFRIGETQVGWILPSLARRLRAFASITVSSDGQVVLTEPGAMAEIAADLAAEGWFPHRGEAFDVFAPDGTALAQIDRAALPSFGMEGYGVHLNGLVRRGDGWHVWIARRAMDRPADPGKLDHLAAGGIPSGLSPWQTLLKEAQEEAGLDPAITAQARSVAEIRYAAERAEGLRRDRLFCFDLVLPEDFTPHPQDGEVTGFELWPLPHVIARVAETDDFKFNVNLVLIDLFLRHGLKDRDDILRRGLTG